MKKRAGRRATTLVGPGAAALDEFEHRTWIEGLSPGKQLALLIAIGIGAHNFGEGLAIGQAAAASQISLAVTLIIGFGLHNATEGFGICGPMSGEGTRPSWAFLGLMGLIGGGPTFLGTVLGQAWSSEAVSVVFFTVAAGSTSTSSRSCSRSTAGSTTRGWSRGSCSPESCSGSPPTSS